MRLESSASPRALWWVALAVLCVSLLSPACRKVSADSGPVAVSQPAEPSPAATRPPAQDPLLQAQTPPAKPMVPAAGALAEGAACEQGSDCASGMCEGQGCGAEALGVCVSRMRPCTTDLQPFCGCDGATFASSSSCPGRRYASRGACEQAQPVRPTGAKGVGEPCLEASACSSGVCEGRGCADDQPGVCAPATRGCTRDLVTYCGCDGQTFQGSGSCPMKRFEAYGACPTP